MVCKSIQDVFSDMRTAGKTAHERAVVNAYPSHVIAQVLRASYQDIRTSEEWWVWLSIHSDEDGPEYVAEGRPSDREDDTWYDYEVDMIGLSEMVDGERDLIKWMLENAIAPDQPFLMRFYGFWSDRDYWGEYDTGYESELVYVEPIHTDEAAQRWEEWLKAGQDNEYVKTVDALLEVGR